MKLKVEKNKIILKTNIKGAVLESNTVYNVYRPFLFGLFRVYVKIKPLCWKTAPEVVVDYVPNTYSTDFSTLEEAEDLITAIKTNPNKFVRYK